MSFIRRVLGSDVQAKSQGAGSDSDEPYRSPGTGFFDIPRTDEPPYTPEYNAWKAAEPEWSKERNRLIGAGRKPPPIEEGRQSYEYNEWGRQQPTQYFELAGVSQHEPPTLHERRVLESAFLPGGSLNHLARWGDPKRPEPIFAMAELRLGPAGPQQPAPVGLVIDETLIGFVPAALAGRWADRVTRWSRAGHRLRCFVDIRLNWDYGSERNPYKDGSPPTRSSFSSRLMQTRVMVQARPDAYYPLPGEVEPRPDAELSSRSTDRFGRVDDADPLETIRRWLVDRGWVVRDGEDSILVAFPKAMVMVATPAIGERHLVVMKCLLVGDLPGSDALYRFATEPQTEFKLEVEQDGSGLVVWLNHVWPADDLGRAALLRTFDLFVDAAETLGEQLLLLGGSSPYEQAAHDSLPSSRQRGLDGGGDGRE